MALGLIMMCIVNGCLDPFIEDKKKVIDDIYLLKNELRHVSLVHNWDGENGAELIEPEVLEVIVADSTIYVKQIDNWDAIDTTYYSINLTNRMEKYPCSGDTYNSVRNVVSVQNGIIVSGWR